MKYIILLVAFFFFSKDTFAQNQALYYFNNGFKEFTEKYPPLKVVGKQGIFDEEVVQKFGNQKRKVYRFPINSGLAFDNSKIQNFIRGSYGIEMYFKYDDGSLLLYNQLLGDDLANKQGKYVHLVTTRNQKTKNVIVYIDGKIRFDFVDTENKMEINKDSEVSFFMQEGQTTTSGTIAMIKLYDFYIDAPSAQNIFKAFTENTNDKLSKPQGILKNLFFVQSSSILLPESVPELESVYDFLMANPVIKIELQGHTDNQGDFDLNLKLSKDRAETVKKFLVEKGIEPGRIKTRGFGSTMPIASNIQEMTRSKNRRVELIIEQ